MRALKIFLKTFFLNFKSPKRRRRDLDKGREGSASVDDCAAEPLLLDPAPGDQIMRSRMVMMNLMLMMMVTMTMTRKDEDEISW